VHGIEYRHLEERHVHDLFPVDIGHALHDFLPFLSNRSQRNRYGLLNPARRGVAKGGVNDNAVHIAVQLAAKVQRLVRWRIVD
jgi:hypothetical protein